MADLFNINRSRGYNLLTVRLCLAWPVSLLGAGYLFGKPGLPGMLTLSYLKLFNNQPGYLSPIYAYSLSSEASRYE